MGQITFYLTTLNSVIYIKRDVNIQNIAVHDIPGDNSIVQNMGRKRGTVTAYGVLNPLTETSALVTLGVYAMSRTLGRLTATVGGQDWAISLEQGQPIVAGIDYSYYIEKIDVQTEPGTNSVFPWGKYSIIFREVRQ